VSARRDLSAEGLSLHSSGKPLLKHDIASSIQGNPRVHPSSPKEIKSIFIIRHESSLTNPNNIGTQNTISIVLKKQYSP
jgi:hypothetical protein